MNPGAKMNLNDLRQELRSHLEASIFRDKVWFVGGCVRDYVQNPQGELTRDIDLTVELPEGGIRLAEYLTTKQQAMLISVHPKYGTASLRLWNMHLEFVATRKETYQLGSRYPMVSFGSLRDDVFRRDFTINSLLLPIHAGDIADLSGMGLSDLEKGLIRSLGSAVAKFREDPLRMLRALRFSLRFGFEIESATHEAMRSESIHLKRLSQKQVRLELDKMNFASNKADIILRMDALGWESILKRLPG